MSIFNLFRRKPAEEPAPQPLQEPPAKPKPKPKVYRAPGIDGQPLPGCRISCIDVAGTSFHQDILLSFAQENPNYNMPKRQMIRDDIWTVRKYSFQKVTATIQPEPNNPADPDAVMVFADGNHVGYVAAKSAKRVRKLLASDQIARVQLSLRGGPYRSMDLDEDADPDSDGQHYKASAYTVTEYPDNKFGCALYIDIKD